MWEENALGGYTSNKDEKRNPVEGETIFSILSKVKDTIPDVPKPIIDLNQSVLDLWNRTPYGQIEEFVPQQVSELAEKAGLPEPVGKGLSLAATIAIPGPGEGMQANKALQGLNRARKVSSKVVDNIDISKRPPNAPLQPAFATVGVDAPNANIFNGDPFDLDKIAAKPLEHIDDVSPSYWHRDFPKTGTLEEKIKFLDTPISKQLQSKNVKGGKITANKLAKNESLTNQLIERAEGIVEKYIKGDQRKLYDFASHNIFNDAEAVYGTGLVKKIQEVFLVTQGREWHHIFGNKEAGEFLLNRIAQDPVLTANLFKHMDKLHIKSGAIAENMALMRVPPHKAWHRFMQQFGTEPRVKMKATDTLQNLDARGLLAQNKKRNPYSRIEVDERPVRMGTIDDAKTLEVIDEQPWKYTAPLDVADYGHSIAEAIQKGETDVNELFTFLTVYHKKYVPWMKKQLKDPKFAAEYLTDLPEGPEKALLLGLYGTKKGPGRASLGTRGRKIKK